MGRVVGGLLVRLPSAIGKMLCDLLDASGPGAPEPGSDIERTAAAVAARGCFRAEWSDEAHRERILSPPVEEKSLKLERTQVRAVYIDLSEDLGMSM